MTGAANFIEPINILLTRMHKKCNNLCVLFVSYLLYNCLQSILEDLFVSMRPCTLLSVTYALHVRCIRYSFVMHLFPMRSLFVLCDSFAAHLFLISSAFVEHSSSIRRACVPCVPQTLPILTVTMLSCHIRYLSVTHQLPMRCVS